MLLSIALILLLGLLANYLFQKIHLPGLIGMLLVGIAIGPYALNLIDSSILTISSDLRQIALIIILVRAGLSLNIDDLQTIGRPAILLCFVPAVFEITAITILGPMLLNLSIVDSLTLGAVLAAVSPAVIVPKMINLMEDGYGTDKKIPQLLLAGASVDDIVVIVLFTFFLSMGLGNSVSVLSLFQIPLSIVTGIIIGIAVGLILSKFFKQHSIPSVYSFLIVFCCSLLLVSLENFIQTLIPFSGLLSVMALGMTLSKRNPTKTVQLNKYFKYLWIVAEPVLFILVGASVNLSYSLQIGIPSILLVVIALAIRMIGVFFCLIKTNLNLKEKLFCMISYLPKATVQAAIGGIPLASGLASGEIILSISVIAILLSAPIGAIGIEKTYQKLLNKV